MQISPLVSFPLPSTGCTRSLHLEIKSDINRWTAETAHVGVQEWPHRAPMLLGNCLRCGSTLTRELES